MIARMLVLASAAAMIAAAPAPPANPVLDGVNAWERGDYAAAVKTWRPLAIAGDADAQFNLGQAYKLGRGVSLDLTQAEDWYRKSAAQGHNKAEDNLGLIMFQNGKRKEALPVLERSAKRDEPRAQYIFGTALFNGDLVTKDWVRAYALMTRASMPRGPVPGLSPASASLAQMDGYLTEDEKSKGRAMARDMEIAAVSAQLPGTVRRPPQSTGPVAKPVDVPLPLPQPEPKPTIVAKPAMPKPAVPKPAVIIGKGWRVQLGAFGDASKARSLFTSLQSRIPALSDLQAQLVPAGAVTRLQAGPIASKAEADKVCAAVAAKGQGCLVVSP